MMNQVRLGVVKSSTASSSVMGSSWADAESILPSLTRSSSSNLLCSSSRNLCVCWKLFRMRSFLAVNCRKIHSETAPTNNSHTSEKFASDFSNELELSPPPPPPPSDMTMDDKRRSRSHPFEYRGKSKQTHSAPHFISHQKFIRRHDLLLI